MSSARRASAQVSGSPETKRGKPDTSACILTEQSEVRILGLVYNEIFLFTVHHLCLLNKNALAFFGSI